MGVWGFEDNELCMASAGGGDVRTVAEDKELEGKEELDTTAELIG